MHWEPCPVLEQLWRNESTLDVEGDHLEPAGAAITGALDETTRLLEVLDNSPDGRYWAVKHSGNFGDGKSRLEVEAIVVVELDHELLGFRGVLAAAPHSSARLEGLRLRDFDRPYDLWDSHGFNKLLKRCDFDHI